MVSKMNKMKTWLTNIQPDIVFGIVDNGLLVIGAIIGADLGGVFGAVLGAALGNAFSDAIGGFFEGWLREWMQRRSRVLKVTRWNAAAGKFIGCMICVPFALLVT